MKAFRIELKKVYAEIYYDLIWQANGKDEEIAMLVEQKDLEELEKTIENFIL